VAGSVAYRCDLLLPRGQNSYFCANMKQRDPDDNNNDDNNGDNSDDAVEAARKTRRLLSGKYGQREADAMSWIILEHLTGRRRGQLIADRDVRLDTGQLG